ncbi:unknown [Prevotella sp. CAG:873]|nr:unknown [Prevotella sp. CAG:873]
MGLSFPTTDDDEVTDWPVILCVRWETSIEAILEPLLYNLYNIIFTFKHIPYSNNITTQRRQHDSSTNLVL